MTGSRLADLVDGSWCVQCGYSHAPADRRRIVAKMLPATFDDIREAWPCFYEAGAAGTRRLNRDLKALGGVFERQGFYCGMWRLAV